MKVDGAHASSSTTSALMIGSANARSSASLAPVLAPASLASVLGDTTSQSPFVALDTAAQSAQDTMQYEVGGANVTIGGIAAPVFAVTPWRISFYVPAGVPEGEAEVIVTSEDGYVSRGTVMVAAVAPAIFTRSGAGTGEAVVINAMDLTPGSFNVTTPSNFGPDKRTRLIIFATGVGGASGAGLSIDSVPGGRVENFAQEVTVEARARDGRTARLAVEFAGAHGSFVGLNQIHVVLEDYMRGVGSVELTITVRGQRSNTATVEIL